MKLFGEITKVETQDDGSIKVVGVASTGAVDDADERVLPDAMKAALPAYMRFGALREMHGMSAAGATLNAEVGEDGATRIEALVVDPVAVRKVQLGVYKGFSIGGKVLERDASDRRVITKLRLNEISLVDRPCNPEAVIDMWKAGGEPPAPSNTAVIERAIAMAREAGKPGRHRDFVVKARETLLVEADADDSETAPANDDEPVVTQKVGARNSAADQARIQAAHDLLVGLGACCDGQDHGQDDADDAGDADDDDLDQDSDDDDQVMAALAAEDLIKAVAENRRLNRALEAVTPHLEALQQTVADLEDRLERLAAQPAPPKAFAGFARAVSKAEDADPGAALAPDADALRKYFEALSPEERGRLQLKAALRQPIIFGH